MKLPNFKQFEANLFNHPLLKKLTDWAKSHSFPGFAKQPIYDVLIFIYREILRDNVITRANSIAFSFFISLFPTIIALFTLIPYFLPYILNDYVLQYIPPETALIYLPNGEVDYNETMIAQLRAVTPDITGKEDAINFVRDIATKPRAGLLSFGFFLAIFFASNGVMSMMSGFEKSHKSTFKRRNLFKKRIVALLLLALITGMLIASGLLIILGNQAIAYALGIVDADQYNSVGLDVLRIFVLISLLYFGISMLYRFGASTKRKFKIFSPGATLAAIFSILSTVGFSFYVNNFAVYNKLYGSIGTVIVIMLLIQINALILLIGFELNASIAVNQDLKALKREEE